MRKFWIVCICALSLGACGANTLPLITSIIGTLTAAAAGVPYVQSAIALACGLSTLYDEVNLLINKTPNATVDQIAAAVCGAHKTAARRLGGAMGSETIIVSGVVLHVVPR